ncbi:squalene/phytoene synthase family protein [Brevibacterium sp. 5221]|uniref:Squalene/phytoene synthase family protein n=1 Tax=Brevibacterium rongguiense TaxID=2695267 RepID=A0A6N9H5M4_9MICO|nr:MULTISPECIES: squalene/phytoene synthase family protein [Brevibacterium]MYM19387.1 squalene/phytoene synthase family protein [Brevibacterium rongguiense]WAL39317.1 squalene/phytoene synthase family protein [Brevibacterium sp. BRM-1]
MTTAQRAEADYARVCFAASRQVIGRYSTSFSLAVRLLPPRTAAQIAALYAMVRIADEVVDGAWPGVSAEDKRAALDAYEARIAEAVRTGHSTDMVVHAFALTARGAGIGAQEWHPFFESMRQDAAPAAHDEASLAAYIHGSAEVVGLMCVRIFTADLAPSPQESAQLDAGACALGAAFQRINFLRDLGHDGGELGRSYLPRSARAFDEAAKGAEIAQIRMLLARAALAFPLLPARVRPAVRCAHALFAELTDELERTPADRLARTRVRVSNPRKVAVAARALRGSRGERGAERA